MKIEVKVKPGSSKEEIEIKDSGEIIVRVNAQPEKGKANDAVQKLIAKELRIPKNQVGGSEVLTPKSRKK